MLYRSILGIPSVGVLADNSWLRQLFGMDMTSLLEGGAAGMAILAGLWKGGGYARSKASALRESRRKLERVWPTRGIAISHLRRDGKAVPGGAYQCLADHHALEVDYEEAIGRCSACGRRFQVMFPDRLPRAM